MALARFVAKNAFRNKEKYVPPTRIAGLQMALGEKEEALRSLEKAYKEHDSLLVYLEDPKSYGPLRSDLQYLARLVANTQANVRSTIAFVASPSF